jgi:hypothetical protein
MNRGANYSSDADLINLITLTKPNVCARAIQQPKTMIFIARSRREKRQQEGRERKM